MPVWYIHIYIYIYIYVYLYLYIYISLFIRIPLANPFQNFGTKSYQAARRYGFVAATNLPLEINDNVVLGFGSANIS